MELFNPADSYIRLATACPEVSVADVKTNIVAISELYAQASQDGAALIVFPELSITGYSLGDLVQQNALLLQAEKGLGELAAASKNSDTAMVVGLPLRVSNSLYNCAAVIAKGEIKGIVPKQNLPASGEFYEKRWYKTWDQPTTTLTIDGKNVPFGNDLLFDVGGVKTGVEVCEDLWVLNAPHIDQVNNGALVIANPSASPELVAKAAYRRDLVRIDSAKMIGAYVYAGCDWTESTTDVVMSGHQIIAASGRIVAERRPFQPNTRVMMADIDIDHLRHDRLRDTNFVNKLGSTVVQVTVERPEIEPAADINPHPFLPGGETNEQHAERLQSIIDIQAHGLARRIKQKGLRTIHLGLSGGLDSTLAFLVGVRAAEIVGEEPKSILKTYTMPGEASSDRTQTNAVKLAKLYGIDNEVVPIGELTNKMLEALRHTGEQDITYENAQARTRTTFLYNKANQLGGIVLGTGDLSEIALGWCTFNADQSSHYHVNAGVPKTLVQHLVQHVATTTLDSQARTVLQDILDTPVSPELVSEKDGQISQKTEDIIGPYELHDFFLYQLIRWGDTPAKVQCLAEKAFQDSYEPEEISKWLQVFTTRFIFSQFKRSVMPDGVKVGSIALSPRGDWRMPSDLYNTAVWQ